MNLFLEEMQTIHSNCYIKNGKLNTPPNFKYNIDHFSTARFRIMKKGEKVPHFSSISSILYSL